MASSRADRAGRMQSRRVPLPPVRPMAGQCRWCTLPTTGRRTSWHAECRHQFLLHSDSFAQRRYLVERDGNRCACCGEARTQAVRGWHRPDAVAGWRWVIAYGCTEDGRRHEFSAVSFPVDVEVEHQVPLWAARVLPRLDRVSLYGPSNLRLLCSRCHKAKTKHEARLRSLHRARNREGATR